MIDVTGVVVEGKKKGRALGFPTANIRVPLPILLAETGIYAGFVMFHGKKHEAALYLAGGDIIEAFIFDFNENMYGQELRVSMIKKIRDTRKFKSDQEAVRQIAKDVKEIKKCLQELSETEKKLLK